MHVKYKKRVEWRISGLKQKWKKKIIFNLKKFKYNHFFIIVTILTIFLHRQYLNFTHEVIGETHIM